MYEDKRDIRAHSNKEIANLEVELKRLGKKMEHFPMLLAIDSEQKAIKYRKDTNCFKCQYLKYESTMEEIKTKKSDNTFYKFCLSNEVKASYCGSLIHGSGLSMSMFKIKKPKQSLCTNYQLNTEISSYLALIQKKHRWKREVTEYKKSEAIRIENEKKIAIEKYEREKEQLRNIDKIESNDIEKEPHRYSERNKSGKFGKEQLKSMEENIL